MTRPLVDDRRKRACCLGAGRPRSSPKLGPTIEALVPGSACEESFSDAAAPKLFSVETATIANAAAERRREFGTVRRCARQALERIGVSAVPIPPDADGAPQWPAGVVGSMTHCPGYRAAVVARSCELHAVGLDAEPHESVPDEALDLILREEERRRLPGLVDVRPDLHWDRVLFCAKEAVYKAWFPLTRRWLDFEDVSVKVGLHGTFEARLLVSETRVGRLDLSRFLGWWMVGRGLVVAGTTFRSCPVAARRADVHALEELAT